MFIGHGSISNLAVRKARFLIVRLSRGVGYIFRLTLSKRIYSQPQSTVMNKVDKRGRCRRSSLCFLLEYSNEEASGIL